MSIYDEKPWLAGYPAGRPRAITPEFGDALSMFAATVARTPDSDAIRYFDGRIRLRRARRADRRVRRRAARRRRGGGRPRGARRADA
jgi:hypothetical protein